MTKLEEVARAIEAAANEARSDYDEYCTPEMAKAAARAAVDALRDPTEMMWRAKDQPIWSLGRPMWDWWKSILDAILNETPGEPK